MYFDNILENPCGNAGDTVYLVYHSEGSFFPKLDAIPVPVFGKKRTSLLA